MSVRSRGALLVAALLSLAASPLAAQKIGFVSTARLLQEMPGRTQVETQVRQALEGLQRRQQVMVDSLNGMIAAFERDSASMSQADKLSRVQQLQAYDARYRDTLQVLEQESQDVQEAALQPLFDQIRSALDEIRAAENFALILDLSREGSQIVAYDRNLDISDRVLTRIRATSSQRPAAPATPRPANPPAAAPATPPAGPVAQPSGARRP